MARVLQLFNVFGAATESAHLDVARGLAAIGHKVSAACESIAPEAPAAPFDLLRHERVQVAPTGDVAAQMDEVARCRVVDVDADLVHGHFGTRVLPAASWLVRGVPVLISLYGYDASRLLRDASWIQRYRWAAERGALFVVLSQAMRERMLSIGLPGARVVVVHLGVDMEAWPFAPTHPDPPRLLFVGRLAPKKGVAVLLDALLQTPKVQLDLLGDGPLVGPLQQAVRERGLADRVRFHGTVPRRTLHDWFSRSTAMVLPSLTAPDGDEEGTPVVLMEAQAAGLPVITTRHAGNGEVVAPEAQRFVVPEADAAALAEAITAMIGLPAGERAALQHAGRRWVQHEFSIDQTVRQLDALVMALLK